MALVTHCIKRPLVGAMVQVQKVPLSRSVQVFGISKNHTEYLQLYLENHARSGGGDIESIEPAAVGDAIIVTFVDAGCKYPSEAKLGSPLNGSMYMADGHWLCLSVQFVCMLLCNLKFSQCQAHACVPFHEGLQDHAGLPFANGIFHAIIIRYSHSYQYPSFTYLHLEGKFVAAIFDRLSH